MHTNYVIFYGNLSYNLNTDLEHISREPPLAAFTQLKPIVQGTLELRLDVVLEANILLKLVIDIF